MYLIKFAFRNLTRHRKRTLITASALAFGLMLFILMDSLLKGAYNESTRNLIEVETGHGKIMSVETFEDINFLPLSNRVMEPDNITSLVDQLGGKAVKRVNINGEMIYTKEYFDKAGSTNVLFTAVDLNKDNEVYEVFSNNNLAKGRFFEAGSDEIVIGTWLADDIGAEIGDFVTLSLRTAAEGDDPGYEQTIDVEIVGLINVPSPAVNRKVVYYPLDMADYSLDLNGSVTDISVKLPLGESFEDFKLKLNARLEDGLGFYSWRELSRDYLALVETKNGASSTILLLVGIIAIVGITNTMLMTINERQRELGMMRAIGMKNSEIRSAFVLEAAGIGLLGGIIGVLFGILLNIPLVNEGIDMSVYIRDMDIGYRLNSVMKGQWDVDTIFVSLISSILLTVIVAVAPTGRAIRKSIPDCINGR